MKLFSIGLYSSILVAAESASVRDIFRKMTTRDAAPAQNVEADGEGRNLQSNCWGTSTPDRKWHPQYSEGWTEGFCRYEVDCNSPGYGSELACCKASYGGQVSGYCLSRLPNPPTTSPTGDSGLDVYYPDYDTAWTEAGCINAAPMPSGRPTYSTMLACCKGAYGGQVSGKCLSMLPSPPTTSPTSSAYEADFWYPDYETSWADATCLNALPLPYKYKGDRPNYSSMLACCKGAYGGQVSGACLSKLPSPPTTSPTGSAGLDVYYPDYSTAWSEAGCINDYPLPSGRPTYSSMLACCKGAYGGQVSGSCVSNLPNPPTTSPTGSGGLDVYYPDYGKSWQEGTCINDAPLPSGRPTYSSQAACCSGAYGNQRDATCQCDVDICYSCKCGSVAQLAAAGCSLVCE